MEKIFMRAQEVADAMEVSVPYAYKLIRQMNKELKNMGCITIPGRIDRKYFYDHFYGTKQGKEAADACL